MNDCKDQNLGYLPHTNIHMHPSVFSGEADIVVCFGPILPYSFENSVGNAYSLT